MRASGFHSKSRSETPLLLPRFPAHAKRVVQEFLHSQDLNKSISVLKEKKKCRFVGGGDGGSLSSHHFFQAQFGERMGIEKAGTAGPQSLKT